MNAKTRRVSTLTHWGAYNIEVTDRSIRAAHPFEPDPAPSPIGHSFADAIDHRSRIREPAIRKSWLEHGAIERSGRRGHDSFISVSWETALELVASELDRVRNQYGNESIFGGSYGWSSAGRFHHGQSQIHRFLNQLGGYTFAKTSYSFAAAEVIIPHVFGCNFHDMFSSLTAWPVIAEHTDLIVMFGGMALKNSQINGGGTGRHDTEFWLKHCRAHETEFINISPLRNDSADFLDADWFPIRPNTDTALLLGIAHTLWENNLHDRDFLNRYCIGFERFLPYLTGESDNCAKNAQWAAEICAIPADIICNLAFRMAKGRTLLTLAWSLQRADHGEQPYWMAAVVAAMLGQIGLPGGGVGYGYGAESAIGNPVRKLSNLSLPQGKNPVDTFIPVARIADMLLNPGEQLQFNGQILTYPDIRLIYWCGGNPFHHHQNLGRLADAWQRPETIIVNEIWWNSMARHCDVVLPVTSALEREDIGLGSCDTYLFAMQKAIEPIGDSRDDYEIFTQLAHRLHIGEPFTEGRSASEWIRHLYDVFRQQAAAKHVSLPDFDEFWSKGVLELDLEDDQRTIFADFRRDPVRNPLATPSGRIEIFSKRIESFNCDDCPGHPVWLPPAEWLGAALVERFPLHLLSNQPSTRLHSQMDCGQTSVLSKINGREPILINPGDAMHRGIDDGEVVRVFNERGMALAGAQITDDIMPGVVVLATGAWYDPASPGGLDRHGNPNTLTLDKGASSLSQAPVANTTLVEIEKIGEPIPEVDIFDPPASIHA